MKKILAIILALLISLSILTLAACNQKTDPDATDPGAGTTATDPGTGTEPAGEQGTEPAGTGEVTQEMLENSKNNEYVFEKLAAGMEVQIGFFSVTSGYFVQEQLMGAGAKYLTDNYGFTCSLYSADNGSLENQIAQLENAIVANELAGMIVQTSDPGGIQDCVLRAQEQGISVVLYGIVPEYDTVVATVDCWKTGYGIGTMASAWCDVKYPDAGEGEIKIAVLGSTTIVPAREQTQGILDAVADDPRFETIYYSDTQGLQVEDGYTGAENALMLDPDVRVFIVFQMASALGVNNYLTSTNYDITEFGVFTGSFDDTTAGMLQDAEEGRGAFRGTIRTAEGIDAYTTMCEAMVMTLRGEVPLGTVINDPMEAWTTNEFVCDYTIG